MRKIAFIGTARDVIPGEDEEVWALNWRTNDYNFKVDRDFQIHDPKKYGANAVPCETKSPTVTQDNYPYEWLENNMPRYLRDRYFKSSMDYMMAYALYEHFTKEPIESVRVYGVNMSIDDDEYYKQRDSFHAWCGYALNHFDVVLDDESSILRSNYQYGVTEAPSHPVYNAKVFQKMADSHRSIVADRQNKVEYLNCEIQAHHATAQAFDLLTKADRAIQAGQPIKDLEGFINALK